MEKSEELKYKLKNITNGKAYVANILKNYKEDELIYDDELFELICHHPTKKLNVDEVEYLVLRKRKPFNKLALFFKINGEEDDISYILCLRNLFNKYDVDKIEKENIIRAFRFEISSGTRKIV